MRSSNAQPRNRAFTFAAIAIRASVLAASLAATGLTAPAALAQSRQGDTRPCPEIDNDADRLACYDRNLRPSRPAAAPATTAAPAAPVAGVQPRREARDATAAAPAAAPAAPVAAAPRPSKKDKDAPANDAAPEPIVIVNIRGPAGRNVFTTETGEILSQADDREAFLPKLPFRAVLKTGFAGGTFLIPDNGRAVRVRRGP